MDEAEAYFLQHTELNCVDMPLGVKFAASIMDEGQRETAVHPIQAAQSPTGRQHKGRAPSLKQSQVDDAMLMFDKTTNRHRAPL
ncbi:hypothetical protein EYF80_003008 [Liparis tanakae]|uniref:Uncharacterized protein n=1 Tax=Liparis tanakae TaxID=230148 RepID=A0A4Z2J8Y1_9TELE|nr:hypothetical protein EYF80_003008 [Liparis tanakae]